MTELRIRVKDVIKEELEKNKDKYGMSINFQVNYALFKYLIIDLNTPLWKLDTRIDPHYESINKLPEDMKDVLPDRKCDNCLLYETKACPPWPNRSPNNWCTQYTSRGDKC